MFSNHNDNAFQTTPYSLNESTTTTIDFINQEVKLKKIQEIQKDRKQSTICDENEVKQSTNTYLFHLLLWMFFTINRTLLIFFCNIFQLL